MYKKEKNAGKKTGGGVGRFLCPLYQPRPGIVQRTTSFILTKWPRTRTQWVRYTDNSSSGHIECTYLCVLMSNFCWWCVYINDTTPTTPQRHLFDWILDTWYILFPIINSTYELLLHILTQVPSIRGTRCTVMQAVRRAVSCLTVSRQLQYNSSSCSCFCTYSVLARRFNWLPRCQRLGTRVTYTGVYLTNGYVRVLPHCSIRRPPVWHIPVPTFRNTVLVVSYFGLYTAVVR